MPVQLGIVGESMRPDYRVRIFEGGDRGKPVTQVDLTSITTLQTSKSLNDISGTWSFVLKDGSSAKRFIREMDVVKIRLRGENDSADVMWGVVDGVSQTGSAEGANTAEESATVHGRCLAKYLQVTSTFLPVFAPEKPLPTALTFGYGGNSINAAAGVTPKQIWSYLYRNFIVGQRNRVGRSGIPNSRFWLDNRRFEDIPGFQIPFIALDEQDMGTALKQFEVLGFTEAWVDELGHVVYRSPQWDAPYTFLLSTGQLQTWSFEESDVDLKTYVEVVPAGSPDLGGANQALYAGRAPQPSSYARSSATSSAQPLPEYVIQTDANGFPTAEGLKNYWYRRQRKYGLRPLQITSPLIAQQNQAQRQAEGLLRFFMRYTKTATVTIPGDPRVRLGTNLRMYGELDGLRINRTYYIEGVQHTYEEGSHYTTTLTLTHGRDPWDRAFQRIVLPRSDPSLLATNPGILNPAAGPAAAGTVPGQAAVINADGTASAPASAPVQVQQMIAAGNEIINQPYVWGGGHGSFTDASGFDCSGAVSHVLHGAGLLASTADSTTLESYGQPGPGQWVTVYANSGHAFMQVAGIYMNTAHGAGSVPAGSGPRWRTDQQASSKFGPFTVRHPPGL